MRAEGVTRQLGRRRQLTMSGGWWVNPDALGRSAAQRHRLRADGETAGQRRALCGATAAEWIETPAVTEVPCPSCVEIEMDLEGD